MAEETRSLRNQAVTGVRWNAVSMVSVMLLQTAQTAALARLLPASEFGLIGLVLVAAAFAQSLADFGLGNAIIYRQAEDPGELSSIYWANVFGGCAAFAVVLAAAAPAASFYAAPSLARLLPLTGAVFLIAPLGQPLQAMLQKDLRFRSLFFCEAGGTLAGAAVAVACAFRMHGAYAFVMGQIAAAAVRAAGLWIASPWHPSLRFRMTDLHRHLSFGLYQTGERLLNFGVQNVDKLLIGRLLGTAALGYYSVAYQMMMRPMLMLNPVVTRVAFPVFARMGGDLRRLSDGFLEVVRLIAFVMMPLYLCLFAASGPLLRFLLGPGWVPAEGVFRVLVFLGLLFSLGNPVGSLMLALGKARLTFWFNAVAFLLYASAIAAGSRHGLVGVAWAQLAVCLGLLVPGDMWLRRRVVGTRPGEYLLAFLPFLAMGCAAAALLLALRPWAERFGNGPALGILAVTGSLAYLALACLWTRGFLARAIAMAAGKA
jgi:lipopolysaccharide exporter